jgi:hypothetical protein
MLPIWRKVQFFTQQKRRTRQTRGKTQGNETKLHSNPRTNPINQPPPKNTETVIKNKTLVSKGKQSLLDLLIRIDI